MLVHMEQVTLPRRPSGWTHGDIQASNAKSPKPWRWTMKSWLVQCGILIMASYNPKKTSKNWVVSSNPYYSKEPGFCLSDQVWCLFVGSIFQHGPPFAWSLFQWSPCFTWPTKNHEFHWDITILPMDAYWLANDGIRIFHGKHEIIPTTLGSSFFCSLVNPKQPGALFFRDLKCWGRDFLSKLGDCSSKFRECPNQLNQLHSCLKTNMAPKTEVWKMVCLFN